MAMCGDGHAMAQKENHMTAQEIEINSSQMTDALTAVHGELLAEGNYDAATRICKIVQEADTVTLAKLAQAFKAAVREQV